MSSREPASPHRTAQDHRADRQVTVRPTPKLVPFLVAGVLAALAIAVVAVIATGPAADYTVPASIGYLTFVLSLGTVPVAAVIWLFLERRSRAHTRTYSAVRTQNDPR